MNHKIKTINRRLTVEWNITSSSLWLQWELCELKFKHKLRLCTILFCVGLILWNAQAYMILHVSAVPDAHEYTCTDFKPIFQRMKSSILDRL